MKKYTTPSVEEIKVVSMDHIMDVGGSGNAGNTGSGGTGYGRPGT